GILHVPGLEGDLDGVAHILLRGAAHGKLPDVEARKDARRYQAAPAVHVRLSIGDFAKCELAHAFAVQTHGPEIESRQVKNRVAPARAEYDALAVRPPGKPLHVLVVMGKRPGLSPGGGEGINVEVEDVTALEGEPAIVRRPAEAGIQRVGRQSREDARITAVAIGHRELYFVVG